jgi:hypothetical protein
MRRITVTLILVMALVGLEGAAFAAKTKKKVSHATAAQTSHRTTTAHRKASSTKTGSAKQAAPAPEPDQANKPK